METGVIACVDGASSPRAVCEYAAWMAATQGVPLTLLNIIEKAQPLVASGLSDIIGPENLARFTEELAKLEDERSRLLMIQGKTLLDGCARWLKQAGCKQMQQYGGLEAILTSCEGKGLMVVGRAGEQSPVGSQLENIIRLQKNPVLATSASFTTPSRVMIAFDGSEESRKNLERLTRVSLLYGLDCHIVMLNGSVTVLHNARDVLRKAGITVQAQLLEGTSVTHALCRYAQEHDIDLIVMGAYGHSGLRRYFIGSHTTAMLAAARQPLLILR